MRCAVQYSTETANRILAQSQSPHPFKPRVGRPHRWAEASATSFAQSAAKQVDDKGDHGKNEEQVDEKTRDVVNEESAGPKQE
jgi:hypothetical protein